LSSPRPGHTGCHCCTHDEATQLATFHRDLATGDVPDAPNESLDAIEELWRCNDGDISGLTQETVLANCTGTATAVTGPANSLDGTPGSIRFAFSDIVPTADDFNAVQIVWASATFDAFSHVAHIASGAMRSYAVSRTQSFSESPVYEGTFPLGWGQQASTLRSWGVCLRVNGLLFLYSVTLAGETGDGGTDACWHSQNTTLLKVIDGADEYRTATVAEMRAAGLTVDPIATQQTHAVGVFMMLHHEVRLSPFTGLPISPPVATTAAGTFDLDTIGINAIYGLDCEAAFVNLSNLTVSTPSHSGVSNCEPHEMRGLSAALTLATMPAYDSDTHSAAIAATYNFGYAYTGSTTVSTNLSGQGGASETATVEVWYCPCYLLTIRFTLPSKSYDAWLSISHSDEYSADACSGAGDGANGHATSPTSAGLFERDIWLPCQSEGVGTRLSVQWYGSDCVDRSNETSWVTTHGIRGKCQQAVSGEPDPVCTTGILPNQLTQITDCYSLDPIAIGYRRRFTNVFSAGTFGPCGSSYAPLEKSYPNNGETHTASLSNPFAATGGSASVDIVLPAHGFSQSIPGSSGVTANADTQAALVDMVVNSGLWPILPSGYFISAGGLSWNWKDTNTLSTSVTINNGGGSVPWAATSGGTGGGSFDFTGAQQWRHNCILHILDDWGFAFGFDSVIGVGSQLVAGHLYFDITE
jgi:hypothetical protein